LVASCSAAPGTEGPPSSSEGADLFGVPLRGATPEQLAVFQRGKAAFEQIFGEADGVGPLFIRSGCTGCHADASRGPGLVEKMVVFASDGLPAIDQSKLPFGHTVRPLTAAGASRPILPPLDATVITSLRVGPSLLARGYVEAIADGEIERQEAEQLLRNDAICGRVNRVVYASEPNPEPSSGAHRRGEMLIGRFGMKARSATLDDFVADALQGDMGITSPLRPRELPNPDGLTDDAKPGVDVDASFVNDTADFLRLIEIPLRRGLTAEGSALFARAKCSVCHVPSLRTRDDYPIAALRGIDAPLYSDLLVHDMGRALADGIADEDSSWREWKTPPLVGLRFMQSYLHDGRAHSIEQAIEMHLGTGSEASSSVRLFRAFSDDERRVLVRFVSAL
jgi:CxxC motif-containing protein (DUF1111 family)